MNDQMIFHASGAAMKFRNVTVVCLLLFSTVLPKNSTFKFCNDFVYCLCQLREGDLAVKQVLAEKNLSEKEFYGKMIKAYARMILIYKNCLPVIQAYVSAKDSTVLTMANTFTALLTRLIDLTNQQIQLTQQLKDNTLRADTCNRRLYTIQGFQRDEFFKITKIANYCSNLIIDSSRTNAQGTLDHLILTQKEREKIVKQLDAYFGSEIRSKNFTKSDYLVQSAWYLRSILQSEYKSKEK